MSSKYPVMIGCGAVEERVIAFVKESVKRLQTPKIVLGLSGGLDSSVCAALCSKACTTHALIMPDSKVTPDSEIADAQAVAKLFDIKVKTIDITSKMEELAKDIENTPDSLGNMRARIRMMMLYNTANVEKCLVVGTSDKSEWLTGYFTKYGDGAADIVPIASLYKSHVRQMAKHLGIPSNIIEKKSAPYLTGDHTAEEELGLTYNEIDPILHYMVDERMTNEQIVEYTNIEMAKVERVRALHETSEHKRNVSRGLVPSEYT